MDKTKWRMGISEKKEMINTLKKKFSYIKNKAQGFKDMQKNPQENFTTVEIDPVSGEHIITIPEWICDEKGWYEGTEVNIEVENDCIIIKDLEES